MPWKCKGVGRKVKIPCFPGIYALAVAEQSGPVGLALYLCKGIILSFGLALLKEKKIK